MNFKKRYSLVLVWMLLLCVYSCKKKDIPLVKVTPVDLDTIAKNYYEEYLKLYPLEATSQGDYRYNDQLPIYIDQDFITAEIAFYNKVQEQLKKIDYQNLAQEKKVIYDVLDATLKDKIERYTYHPEYIPFNQFEGLPLQFPMLGSGQGDQPFVTEKDYDNWLKRINQFSLWMDAAITNFEEGAKNGITLPKKLVIKMIPQMRADEITTTNMDKNIFYGPIRNLPKNFTQKSKDKYTLLYKEAILEKIIPAYNKMGDYLEKNYYAKARDTDGIHALPNGNDIYHYYVRSWTTTDKSVEDIHQIGLQEVAKIRSEMETIKTEVGYEGSLQEFLSFVKEDPKAMPYKTSKEVLDAFQSTLNKIQPKLNTLFKVTPKTPFEIRQTEKFREATSSPHYVQGTPDGKRAGIFYIPLPEPHRFNVTTGMESLFLHEAIPGHHYQISLQQENENLPKFMRFGWYGAYGEGWALYTENLGKELGLYTDPYQRLGALNDQMLRAVRLVVDTGIHTGKMSREQAIRYFLANIAYDDATATAEIERYMAIPAQALSYKIGQLKILELRDRYTKKLGEKFNIALFHEEILNQGCMPLQVLERKMENWAKVQAKKP